MPRQNDPYALTQNADGSWSAGVPIYTTTQDKPTRPNKSQVEGFASGEMAGPLNPAATEFNTAVAGRKPHYDTLKTRADYLKSQGIDPNSFTGFVAMNNGDEIDKKIAELKGEEAFKASLGGRQFIDDATWETYVGLGYDPLDLREEFIPESDRAIIDAIGVDRYLNAPAFQKKEPLLPDAGGRALILQQALGPYLQRLGDDFKKVQAGARETNNNLLNQMDQTYRPFMEAINNNVYASQDQTWLNTLNTVQMAPELAKWNQLLAAQVAATQQAISNQGSGDDFLTQMAALTQE